MRLASLIFLFLSAYAGAQQSGVSQSPYAAQQRSNPLNNFVLRLGLPVFTHGPGFDIGDVVPCFTNTVQINAHGDQQSDPSPKILEPAGEPERIAAHRPG